MVPSDRLHSVLNPPEGFLATANDDHNPPEGPLVVNLPMGAYRADRIRALLGECSSCTLDDMERIQNDLYSVQAERFMAILRPLLPSTFAGRMLGRWDLRYDTTSRGATLFETVYHALLREVCGKGLFGEAAWDATVGSTAILADYYHLFDDILLGDDPSWFGMEGREQLFSRVLDDVLTEVDLDAIAPGGPGRPLHVPRPANHLHPVVAIHHRSRRRLGPDRPRRRSVRTPLFTLVQDRHQTLARRELQNPRGETLDRCHVNRLSPLRGFFQI